MRWTNCHKSSGTGCTYSSSDYCEPQRTPIMIDCIESRYMQPQKTMETFIFIRSSPSSFRSQSMGWCWYCWSNQGTSSLNHYFQTWMLDWNRLELDTRLLKMHFAIGHFVTNWQHWANTKVKKRLPLLLNLFTLQITLIRPFCVNLCDKFMSHVGELPILSLHWTL